MAYVLIGTALIKGRLNTSVPNEKSSRLGSYISTTTADETVKAFVPPALPPDPPLDLSGLYQLLDRANQAPRSSGWSDHSSARYTAFPLPLCPQRSPLILAD